MYLSVDENPNCPLIEPRVFQERSEPQPVTHVLRQREGEELWCPIVGWGANGKPAEALARKVDDSGEGTCYLVYGGRWGLRLKEPACDDAWSMDDPHQWGEAFLLLPAEGSDLRFGSSAPEETDPS
jgi:hypothetical protein